MVIHDCTQYRYTAQMHIHASRISVSYRTMCLFTWRRLIDSQTRPDTCVHRHYHRHPSTQMHAVRHSSMWNALIGIGQHSRYASVCFAYNSDCKLEGQRLGKIDSGCNTLILILDTELRSVVRNMNTSNAISSSSAGLQFMMMIAFIITPGEIM